MTALFLTGFRQKHALEVLSLAACLGGCFSYRGGAVPEIDPSTIAVPRMQRIVAYDLRVDSNVGGDYEIKSVARRELELALRSAGAEPKLSGSVAEPDALISVDVKVRGNPGAQFLSGLLSGFTFTIVPAYASVHLTTEAELRTDTFPKRYRYDDSVSFWVQLFLLPFTNSVDDVRDNLIADMMRSLTRDLQREGVLPAPGDLARIIHESSAASANCTPSRAVLAPPSSTYCRVCLCRLLLRLARSDAHLALSRTNIHE